MSEETLTKEEIEQLKKDAEEAKAAREKSDADAKAAQKAMTDELQAERQRRKAAEEELERNKGTQNNPNEEDPEKVFQRLRDKERQEEAKKAREEALAEFKQSTRELNEENDPAGLVFSAFEKEMKKFSFEGLTSKQQYLERFKDIHGYMNRHKTESRPTAPNYSGGEGIGSTPKEDDTANLTDAESRLMKDMGWDKERFLKQKEKRPHYVAQLLKYRS